MAKSAITKEKSSMPESKSDYAAGILTRIRSGTGSNEIEEGIRKYPYFLASWKDQSTNHTILMSLAHHAKSNPDCNRLADQLLNEAGKIGPKLKADLLNMTDRKGRTALDWASTPSMKLLLSEHGADKTQGLNLRGDNYVAHVDDPTIEYSIVGMAPSVRRHLRDQPEVPRR
jgi:hypothetical protein